MKIEVGGDNDLASMTDDDLAWAHEKLSTERNTVVATLQTIHDEQDRRLTEAAVLAELAALSPAARAALLAGKG